MASIVHFLEKDLEKVTKESKNYESNSILHSEFKRVASILSRLLRSDFSSLTIDIVEGGARVIKALR